jgi:hypothetical protein
MTKWLLNWRVWALGACFLWGCYFMTWWRTMDFGLSWWGLLGDGLVCLLFVLPFAVPAVLFLAWRQVGSILLALALGSILAAEVFAGAQEWFVLWSYGQNPGRVIFVNRLSPYRHHEIVFSPGYGWSGND